MRLRGCLRVEGAMVRLWRYTGCVWGQVDCAALDGRHPYSRTQFQAEPRRCSYWVAPTIERI